jgi:biotin carboxyl carrier protein
VKEGQELLIIESMKMEIPVEATATGVVASVLVGEKSPIDVGDVLITLESD